MSAAAAASAPITRPAAPQTAAQSDGTRSTQRLRVLTVDPAAAMPQQQQAPATVAKEATKKRGFFARFWPWILLGSIVVTALSAGIAYYFLSLAPALKARALAATAARALAQAPPAPLPPQQPQQPVVIPPQQLQQIAPGFDTGAGVGNGSRYLPQQQRVQFAPQPQQQPLPLPAAAAPASAPVDAFYTGSFPGASVPSATPA